MPKHFMKFIPVLVLMTVANAQALPIVDADAFVTGDHKAAVETSTGLTWMDFGVTNNESLTQVEGELSTVYQGWRLPTEGEVKHLSSSLFSGIAGWDADHFGPSWSSVSYSSSLLSDVFSIFGYSGTDNYWYFDSNGTRQDRPVIWSQSHFRRDDGLVAELYFSESSDTGDNSATGYVQLCCGNISFSEDAVFPTLGTLLVKADTTTVPEPSSLLLMCLGLYGLVFSRRRKII